MADVIKLESLHAENYKCHLELDLDFSENKLVVISGRNGTGKSAILDSIFWCLYDETIQGLKGDSVVTKRVGKDCYVRLIFTINNLKYEIHNYRKHSKFKNTKILIRDGKQISTDMDVSGTNDIIQNIFMSKDVFTNCLLFSTFVKNSFTEMTHSGQKDILDKLLGFEKYNDMYQKVSDSIVEENNKLAAKNDEYVKLKFEIESLEKQIPKDIELYTEIQNNTKNKGVEFEQKIKTLKEQLSTLSVSTKDLNAIKKSLEKTQVELNKVNNKLENLNTQLEYDKKSIRESQHALFSEEVQTVKNSTISQVDKYKEELSNYLQNEYTPVVVDIEKDILSAQNALDSFNITKQSKLDTIEKRLLLEMSKVEEPFKEKYKAVLDLIYNLEMELRNISNSINQNSFTHKLKSDELKNIKDNKDFCTLCKQPLADKTHIEIKRRELLVEIAALEKERTELLEKQTIQTNSLESETSEKYNIENQIQLSKNRLNDLSSKAIDKINTASEEEYKKLNDNANSALKNINYLKAQLALRQSANTLQIEECKVSEAAKLNEIKDKYKTQYDTMILELVRKSESAKGELETLKSLCDDDINKFNSELESMVDREGTIERCKTSIALYTNEMNALKETYKKDGATYKKNIDDLKKELKVKQLTFDCMNGEFDKIKETIQILTFWKKAFSDIGIKSVLLDESIPFLNKRAKELSELTEHLRVNFVSQTTLKSGKTNNKFSINAINSKHLSEYSEFSAGETRLTNIIILLCLRDLMENMAGKKINLLLLDEILDTLDEQNSEIASKIIQHLSNDYFVMLITHTHKSWILADEDIRL